MAYIPARMSGGSDKKPVLDYPDGDALVGDCHPHEILVLKVLIVLGVRRKFAQKAGE